MTDLDKLRKWADWMFGDDPLTRDVPYAAADAWEAQIDLMNQSYHTLSVAYNATCKRLEEAETELRAANKEMALQTERSLSSWVIDALVKRGFQVVPPALAGEE